MFARGVFCLQKRCWRYFLFGSFSCSPTGQRAGARPNRGRRCAPPRQVGNGSLFTFLLGPISLQIHNRMISYYSGGGKKKGVKGKNELPPQFLIGSSSRQDGRDFAFVLRSVHAPPAAGGGARRTQFYYFYNVTADRMQEKLLLSRFWPAQTFCVSLLCEGRYILYQQERIHENPKRRSVVAYH